MTTFKVPCPSCEAKVLIKNVNLIGTKVECPKCKYRFKVEEPKEQAAGDEAKPAKATPEDTKKSAARKKKLIAAVLAVVAVGLLAVGGYAFFGSSEKKPNSSGGGTTRTTPGGNTPVPNPGDDKDKKDNKDEPPPKKVFEAPYSDKDSTNLLPGKSVAVYRFDLERLRLTPLGTTLFDKTTNELFSKSMGFDVKMVEKYFHCVVGEKERAPFGLICLKEPMLEKEIRIAGAGPAQTVNKKSLMPVKGNPFFLAVGQSFSGRSLLADVYEAVPATAGKSKDLAIGACIYDSQHIIVGEYSVVESFLKGLTDGYPEFLTVYKKDEAPTAPMPGAPMLPPVGPAGAPMPTTLGALPTTPPAPVAPKSAAPTNKDYTSNPSYLSVPGDLKKMLNALEDVPSGAPSPSVVMAEKFNNEVYTRKGVKKGYETIVAMIDPVLERTAFFGMNLTNFTPQQCALTIRIVGKSAEAAQEIAIKHLSPSLKDGVPLLSLLLDTQILLRNFADPNAMDPGTDPMGPGIPGGPGFPGGPGPMGPPGGPMGPKPGGSAGGPPPGSGAGGAPGLPPPPPGGSIGGLPGGPPPGGGSIGGLPGGPPPGGGLPGGPPTGPGTGPSPTTPSNPTSQIDLRLTDFVVTISVTINWTDEVYGQLIFPRLFGLVNQLKGKTNVYAGSGSWIGLAKAVEKYVDQNKKFPAATIARPPSDPSRLGLGYPPVQRLSFFAELLPYLGRSNVSERIVRGAAWFDGANADAVDSWVPEFLVPYYDQTAWRATSPFAPGRILGGTNFVAVAGIGRDAARFDPKNPAQQKAIGISGYDFGSTVDEVADGPANTIYLLQVPPELTRPWAAGGGATAVGLNPTDPMADFKHQRPDGKWGTYAIMGDGAVRWLPADIKPADFLALATRAGGEKLSGELDAIAPLMAGTGKAVELKADPKPADPKPADPKAVETAPAPKAKE